MIGLGSNRLSVCRLGGMSVTQAGKGGMEWLAGGRMPDWVSPYSAAATAALKAQFPTQWPTIRDYGFAHPEIVGYMNAYAPEDAKIAYSLVEGIGTRWLNATGIAYVETGKTFSSGQYMEFVCKFASDRMNLCGGRKQAGATDAAIMLGYQYLYGSSWTLYSVSTNTAHHIKFGFDIYEVDDTVVKTRSTSLTSSYTLSILCGKSAQNTYNVSSTSAERSWSYWNLVSSNNEILAQLVPYIKNNVCGMLDLLDGIFYPAQGEGEISISETPAS